MWCAVILAGGSGSRMGADRNKVLLPLDGKSVIRRSVRAFASLAEELVLVARKEDMAAMASEMAQEGLRVTLVAGGASRQESVWNGLQALPEACDMVMIHDGARCLIDRDTICRCMEAAERNGTGVAAVAVTDTIKAVTPEGLVSGTPDRATLRAVQTPQAFRRELIVQAHRQAQQDGFLGTDDASLVEHLGQAVQLVEGNRRNLKLTTPEDMRMAEAFLHDSLPSLPTLRIGQGYDVHRLVEGRDLILCGVTVPHTLGLLGHSDADVALHALMDAMLGAMALGDIGKHFPDTDERYRGISSMTLLHHVVALLEAHHARVTNCDVTIVAQKPKLLPYVPKMRENVAQALSLPLSQVNIKATTTERLGFEGEEKGISAQAICMVQVLPEKG